MFQFGLWLSWLNLNRCYMNAAFNGMHHGLLIGQWQDRFTHENMETCASELRSKLLYVAHLAVI